MLIRTVVVDDENPARNELCFLLEQLDDVDVVGQARNGLDAMEIIRKQQPDLVLLDIQMPGRTGFEVTRELLVREVDTQIVFVTAYDQYAIEAFEVNAVDYLLKPVEARRLQQSIERVKRRLTSKHDTAQDRVDDQQLERVLQQVSQRRTQRERIALKVGERFQLVPSNDIIYASLVNDAITVVAGSLTGTSNFRTLDELQSNLDSEIFWRVHRSHLVNINKVKEIVPWFSRNYILKMKDAKATEIPVSRAQTKRLREYLGL
jgi:two-component system LytT family response regulator/two-component system response regulator LytT